MLEYEDNKRISFEDLLTLVSKYKDMFKKPNEDVFVNCLKTQQDKKVMIYINQESKSLRSDVEGG